MKREKTAKNGLLRKTEELLSITEGILTDLPNIILYGTAMAEIDNFKGLLDFSPGTVRLNTTDGIVRIDGINLFLAIMTDDSITVKGEIKNICFE